MIYATPAADRALTTQLREFDALRQQLGDTARGGPWLGQLRRQVRASTMSSSVSIEGFHVPTADSVALVAGDEPPGHDDANRLALASYAHAMNHVATLSRDPHFRWLDRVLLDLHFDACSFQRDRSPGLWRTGPVYVTRAAGREPAYTGPDAAQVPKLMAETVRWLAREAGPTHLAVRAAMAHLHLVSMHPFADGNGRLARIVQSLVLAREGLLAPEFNSIEEYLGAHTAEYYAALQQVQGGRYQPQRDAMPWVRFCVAAHLDQARARLAQVKAAAARWELLEGVASARAWPDRVVIALEQSLFGGVDRKGYALESGVSLATATTDLRRLADAGLLQSEGRAGATRYTATGALRALAAT